MKSRKAVLNWSGGKDSSLSLHKTLVAGEYDVVSLLTSVNGHFQRVSMHGVRLDLLERQAASIGIPLTKVVMPEMPDISEYESLMNTTLERLRNEGVEVSIFGDVFLEDLRKYREEMLSRLNLKAEFPLWQIPTREIMQEFIGACFKAVIVCVDERCLDKSFAGREIDSDFLEDLPSNVDPCGEYGEYHSFVYDGPIFKAPIMFEKGEIVYKRYQSNRKSSDSQASHVCASDSQADGYWYCDLIPT